MWISRSVLAEYRAGRWGGPGVYTNPGFGVDTSGNGLAPSVSGTGLVSYTDVEDTAPPGGGVQLETMGRTGFRMATYTSSPPAPSSLTVWGSEADQQRRRRYGGGLVGRDQ
jgi:hypothetical protein